MARRKRRDPQRDYDARAWPHIDNANLELELTYLRAGSDPNWERVKRNGEDITDQPQLWTPYQRARRRAFEERVAGYRQAGML